MSNPSLRLALLITAGVTVLLVIAAAVVVPSLTNAQTDGGRCLEGNYERGQCGVADYTLHLVNWEGNRLGLSNRELEQSITLRNMWTLIARNLYPDRPHGRDYLG